MAKGATLVRVIIAKADGQQQERELLVTLGDSLQAQQWAKKEYPFPPAPRFTQDTVPAQADFDLAEYREAKAEVREQRDNMAGLYSFYLAARRAHEPAADGEFMEFMSAMTMPEDETAEDEPTPEPGESLAPPSEH